MFYYDKVPSGNVMACQCSKWQEFLVPTLRFHRTLVESNSPPLKTWNAPAGLLTVGKMLLPVKCCLLFRTNTPKSSSVHWDMPSQRLMRSSRLLGRVQSEPSHKHLLAPESGGTVRIELSPHQRRWHLVRKFWAAWSVGLVIRSSWDQTQDILFIHFQVQSYNATLWSIKGGEGDDG